MAQGLGAEYPRPDSVSEHQQGLLGKNYAHE